jgi:hypothetical protein
MWGLSSNRTKCGAPHFVRLLLKPLNHVHEYKNGHVIIDTEGNPTDDDFRDLATNCDLLVIPAVPESVATDGQQLRDMLVSERIPVFNAEIPRLAAFEKAARRAPFRSRPGIPLIDDCRTRLSAAIRCIIQPSRLIRTSTLS